MSDALQTRAILRVIVLILAIAALLWAVYRLESVLLLLVFALFFAYLIAPLVELVRRPFVARGNDRLMPRALAIGVVYLVLFGAIAIASSVLLPRLGAQVSAFAKAAPTYASHLRDRVDRWKGVADIDQFPPSVRDGLNTAAGRGLENVEKFATGALVATIGVVSYLPTLILIPIIGFFLLKDADVFRESALRALPTGEWRGRGAEFFSDVNATLSAYIRAQLLACLLIATICTIGFSIIGVPYALVLGLFAGVLEFIPLVGPLIVAVTAVVLSSFQSGAQALAVLVFLAVLRVVEDYGVYPRLIGHGIHLHPLAVIVAILCGAELGGIAGIFLAIPVVAVLSVAHRHWLEHRGSEGLVADLLKPPLE
jgi:predicted PurR-regulated permease PerM